MGIFDKIKGAIWGHDEEPAAAAPTQNPRPDVAVASATTASPTASNPAPAGGVPTAVPGAKASSEPSSPARTVDVASVLDSATEKSGQKLNWRTSIVDLMKALNLDSSLSSRKELAAELGYKGSTSDSAAMNMWLHKQVIQKLKENGGKVPPELL